MATTGDRWWQGQEVKCLNEGVLKDGTENYGIDYRYFRLKFDSEDNQDRDGRAPKGMAQVEYLYSNVARECQIDMPKRNFIIDGEDFHYLIERFGLIDNSGRLDKLYYASWCGINHAHRDAAGACGYE
ncbi:MAG: hypothetical protein DRQ61_05110 [Gammaproteobacteria bacterium]|nr:MAG: hypothetical protein DRQ61_05110 [Gammaproteobacteria bacterium]